MGRASKQRWKGRKGNGKDRNNNNTRDNSRTNGLDRDSYVQTVVKEGNFKFEAYYAAQGIHNEHWEDNSTTDATAVTTSDNSNIGTLVPGDAADFDAWNRERLAWRKQLGEILPSSFRIAKTVAPALQQQMEAELHNLVEETVKNAAAASEAAAAAETNENEKDDSKTTTKPTTIPVVKSLSFLPHAYQLNVDRNVLRKTPEFQKLGQWLQVESECGHITRQEAVSMIPPVVLDVQPNDRVLDLCAAPGSKSSQLLECLGPDGVLVANDVNPQRAFMLTHQLKRIWHLNPAALITACDAQHFPGLALRQFDKVLADVPCSGDGTTRKNIGVWKSWTMTGALGLHNIQVEIAWKGVAQLLAVGGHLVYSTCSLNPLENEAVVAELLRRGQGNLQLEVIALDGFRTRPGRPHWKVMSEGKSRRQLKNERNKSIAQEKYRKQKEQEAAEAKAENGDAAKPTDAVNTGTTTTTDKEKPAATGDADIEMKDDAPASGEAEDEEKKAADPVEADRAKVNRIFEPTSNDPAYLTQLAQDSGLDLYETFADVPEHLQKRIRISNFPPTPAEIAQFHLERCIRCYAHDNDTGGFFVAKLIKTGPISAADRKAGKAKENNEDAPPVPKKAKTVVDAEEETATKDMDNAEAAPPPKPSSDGRGVRRDENFYPCVDAMLDPIVDYYGLSPAFPKRQIKTRVGQEAQEAKHIYYVGKAVQDLFEEGIQDRVTIINAGLKMFTRNSDKECAAKYRIAQEAIHFIAPYMMKRKFVLSIDDFQKALTSKPIGLDTFSPSFAEAVRPLDIGSFVAVLEGFEDDPSQKMVASLWRCRGDNINALVGKADTEALKNKLKSMEGNAATTATSTTESGSTA